MDNYRFYMSVLVSVVILTLWALVIAGVVPTPQEDMREVLKVAAASVIGYWIGSSSGSAVKDRTMNMLREQVMTQLPGNLSDGRDNEPR